MFQSQQKSVKVNEDNKKKENGNDSLDLMFEMIQSQNRMFNKNIQTPIQKKEDDEILVKDSPDEGFQMKEKKEKDDSKGNESTQDNKLNDKDIEVVDDGGGTGIAIAVAFVDDKAALGSGDKRKVLRFIDNVVDKLNGKKKPTYPVHHAGVIIINKKTGLSSYYDFGRFHTSSGKKGRVRSSKTDNLKILDAEFDENGNITNLSEIMESLVQATDFNGDGDTKDPKEASYFEDGNYGTVKSSVYNGELDYDDMKDYIVNGDPENNFNGTKKESDFGLGDDQTVCASFVRRVIAAGGGKVSKLALRGGGTVRNLRTKGGQSWKGEAGDNSKKK